MSRLRRCFIFLLTFSCLPSLAISRPVDDWAFQLLVFEAYLQEFRLLTEEPERLQFNTKQLRAAWLGAYHAKDHSIASQARHTNLLSKLDELRVDFAVDEQALSGWQSLKSTDLINLFLQKRPFGPQGTTEEVSQQLKNHSFCTLSDELTQAVAKDPKQFLPNGSAKPAEGTDLDCLAQHIVLALLESEFDSPSIQAWLDGAIKLSDTSNLRVLAAWSALEQAKFRASLGYLYPIVRDAKTHRYAFELIQRLYQLHEKGRGVVAIKGL